MTLHEKVAIVTGASRGIGRSIAERLAREGAAVVVNYHRDEQGAEETIKAISDAGGRATAVRGDVGVPDEVRNLYAVAAREYDAVDIVVNNAAIVAGGPIETMSEADFDRLIGRLRQMPRPRTGR